MVFQVGHIHRSGRGNPRVVSVEGHVLCGLLATIIAECEGGGDDEEGEDHSDDETADVSLVALGVWVKSLLQGSISGMMCFGLGPMNP